jgi:anti-anti-sigma factor
MIASALYPHLEVREAAEAVDVTLVDCPQLDEDCLETVREELLGVAETFGQRHLFINLVHVEYMPSAGLGLLLTLKKKLERSGGRLTVCNLGPMVRELFVVTRLTSFFHILEAQN